MANLNRVILIGRLTHDPELKYTPSGTARTRFQIAVNSRWRDRQGNLQEETTFVHIVVWGAQAENCVNYLAKGQQVAVEGRLRIGTFQTEEGEKRKITEVVARNVQFLGGGKREELEAVEEGAEVEVEEKEVGEEEIPF